MPWRGGLTAGGRAAHNGPVQRVRTISLRTSVAVAALAAAGGLVLAWTQRAPIAESAIRGWLDGEGIDGAYRIDRLEPGRAVLRDVRLAGGAFSAARVEVRLAGWPFAPRPVAVTLDRPILQARADRTGLSLGGLERLIPADTDPNAPLPDIDLQLRDGVVLIATPAGTVGATLRGGGRLTDGFRGVAILMPIPLTAGGCRSGGVGGGLTLTTAVRRIRVTGRGPLRRLICTDAAMARSGGWALDLTTDPGGRRLAGSASVALLGVRGGGAEATRLVLGVGADGAPGVLRGRWRVTADQVRGGDATVDRVSAEGAYAAQPLARRVETDWTLRAAGLRPPPLDLPELLAPLGRALRPAGGFDTQSAGRAAWRDGVVELQLDRLALTAASGARIEGAGAPLLRLTGAGWQVAGGLGMAGGGLPRARLSAAGLSPRGGTARLALTSLRVAGLDVAGDIDLARAREGWQVAAALRAAGRTAGWSVGPTALSGRAMVGDDLADVRPDGCLTLRTGALARPGAAIAPTTARLCADARRPLAWSGGALRGSATLAPVRLAAALGGVRVSGSIGGRVDLDGGLRAAGTIAGFAAGGDALPVRIGAGQAVWRWRDDMLSLTDGRARLTDALAEPRFEPMMVRAVTARLAEGRIDASGELGLAKGARLLGFTASQALSTGTGVAKFATGPILFGEALQPDEISTAFRGVVANVEGTVSGAGEVRWTADGVTSRGHAETAKLDLATAALGPVGGVSGRIEFDDLIAVTTPPGQQVRVASINPGVLVENGIVTFRMLGPTRVAVAGAEWPFVGGRLTLRPTVIAADEPLRRFTLDVDGADAAQFLARFDIPNLNVTGIFDGQMPLVFDGASGRIEKGLLVARPPGGVIQYAGEVGADAMGAGGRLAFDALKRLRYRSLGLEFDGALDGEIVTAIRFTGTNEAPVAPAGGVPVRASGLPFKFNVTVRAPFRQLLGAAASFGDVRETIRAGAAAEGAPATDPPAPQRDK
jgi:hypothetical protein